MKSTAYAKNAILTTLTYSDIFDFSLSRMELWDFLVGEREISKKEFDISLYDLIQEERIVYMQGYYALMGRGENIQRRIENIPEVKRKMAIAKRAAFFVSHIPTIKLIGLSGGLAMKDADKWDDIDFFIIAKKGSVYITRLWILIILQVLGLRRTRFDKNPADKICVNMIIDENNLAWDRQSRDIYTAHEIAQLKPLFIRSNIFMNFQKSNKWTSRFFINLDQEREDDVVFLRGRDNLFFTAAGVFVSSPLFSFPARLLQEYLIKRNRTREKVENGFLALQPIDYRAETLRNLKLKLLELGLLTKF